MASDGGRLAVTVNGELYNPSDARSIIVPTDFFFGALRGLEDRVFGNDVVILVPTRDRPPYRCDDWWQDEEGIVNFGSEIIEKLSMLGDRTLAAHVEMGFILHLLQPGDLFLDIGANIGSYTILASKVCGARAVAFEPDPETAKVLRRNITMNHLDALATVREIALAGHTGDAVAFTIGLDTMNRVARPDDKTVRMVPVRRLDDIPDAGAATLIKLDARGTGGRLSSTLIALLACSSVGTVQPRFARNPKIIRV